jgi:yecA family protein
MQLARIRTKASGPAEAGTVLPPNLRTLESLSFTDRERTALQDWLAEAGWPRGALDIHALEGYLVALLIWPVELPCGAWLPPIWGERGWKVPAKLAGPLELDRFVAMVSAFLKALDDRLYTSPIPYVPAVAAPVAKRLGERPDSCSWANGFLGALLEHTHAQGLKYRSKAVKDAATAIARCASMPPSSDTSEQLRQAVYAMAAERTSRGPLETRHSAATRSSNPRRKVR